MISVFVFALVNSLPFHIQTGLDDDVKDNAHSELLRDSFSTAKSPAGACASHSFHYLI